jgi:hypothetical protein
MWLCVKMAEKDICVIAGGGGGEETEEEGGEDQGTAMQ